MDGLLGMQALSLLHLLALYLSPLFVIPLLRFTQLCSFVGSVCPYPPPSGTHAAILALIILIAGQ